MGRFKRINFVVVFVVDDFAACNNNDDNEWMF